MTRIKVLFLIITVFIVSCTTAKHEYDRKNPYPGIETLNFKKSHAYFLSNESSDKLVIVIEGSGWRSVLGVKNKNYWSEAGLAALLLQELRDTHNFLIPEKLKRQPGMMYNEDMEDRANYTADNLIEGYIDSINGHLAEHNYSNIILAGASEGACLLPLLYERMNKKEKVTAMVIDAFGGLSIYESYEILKDRPFITREWEEAFTDILTAFNPKNITFPDSYIDDYYGLTQKYFGSFVHIRPFDYYKNINVPILFLHGTHDFSIPVESTIYVQENLPDKPFEYKYFFNWDHQPRNAKDVIEYRKAIAGWILSQ